MFQPIDYFLLVFAVALAIWMLRPAVKDWLFWRATVTPLASIIGSGFLIIAPLLGAIAGQWALLAVFGTVLVAYGIGAIIRFNIRYAEPALSDNPSRALLTTERLSNFALSLAYVVSIAFYLRLMASFVLQYAHAYSDFRAQCLTSVVLIFIGLVGWLRGLGTLERLEEYSVSIKLAIIGSLLVGLFHHNRSSGFIPEGVEAESMSFLERLRMLAGMLLVFQGFETSRYLAKEYSVEMRIRTMRVAQWLSGAIYLLFVFLVAPLLPSLNGEKPQDTAIIELAGHAALILPFLLVVAAVMSQFSAAVADSVGAGGLVEEESHNRISAKRAYPIIVGLAIVLVWGANVFEIITFASRAFAIYYFSQALVALLVVPKTHKRLWLCRALLAVGAIVLLAVAIFAVPAG